MDTYFQMFFFLNFKTFPISHFFNLSKKQTLFKYLKITKETLNFEKAKTNLKIVISFSDIENSWKLANRGLLIFQIPDLTIYTIKAPLIVRNTISTVFYGSQKPNY